MKTIVNKKAYTVEPNFNSYEANWIFRDKKGIAHLVDSADAQEWASDAGKKWQGAKTAIEYAKEVASNNDEGVFWWTISETK